MNMYELKKTIQDLLLNLSVRIPEIAELFRDSSDTAITRFNFFLEDITALINGISVLLDSNLDIQIQELDEKLLLLTDELVNKDYEMVADILLFELKPIFEFWSDQLVDA